MKVPTTKISKDDVTFTINLDRLPIYIKEGYREVKDKAANPKAARRAPARSLIKI